MAAQHLRDTQVRRETVLLCSTNLRSAWRRLTANFQTSCHFLPGRCDTEKQDFCHSKATGVDPGENQDKPFNCTCQAGAVLGWTVGGLRRTNTQVLKEAGTQSLSLWALAWTHSSAEAGRRQTSQTSGRETAPRTASSRPALAAAVSSGGREAGVARAESIDPNCRNTYLVQREVLWVEVRNKALVPESSYQCLVLREFLPEEQQT